MPGHSHDLVPPFDLERDRQLLSDAGYPGDNGLPELELGRRSSAHQKTFVAESKPAGSRSGGSSESASATSGSHRRMSFLRQRLRAPIISPPARGPPTIRTLTDVGHRAPGMDPTLIPS
jgi:hypothetical protein